MIILLILLLTITTGQHNSHLRVGDLVGSAVFVDETKDKFVSDATNVSIMLQSDKRKQIQVKSDGTGKIVESLPEGHYCLRAAYTATKQPLYFSSRQHRCFKNKVGTDIRFDVMLLMPSAPWQMLSIT